MKKLITLLSLTLILGFISEINAQVRWGLKGGLDRSNVRYYHPFSSSRYGFEVGGFAYIPINDNESLYLQPEVLYMQAGEFNKGTYPGNVKADERYFIDYIAVPVMLKAYFSDHYNTFFGEVGPQLAFKISQKSTSNLDEIRALTDYGPDGDVVSPIDFSLGFGVGFSYERQWEVSFRYNWGFTDVYPETVGENRAKTNNSHVFALTLHYIFD